MKEQYEIVFITTIPAFYKVKLFNEIAKNRKIMVIYTGSRTGLRSKDFLGEKSIYEYTNLSVRPLKACVQIVSFLQHNKVERLIVSGWDTIVSYAAALVHPKSKNGCIVESSIFESSIKGIKALFKRILFKRVSVAYVSGDSQRKLVEGLHFSGRIVEFGGCGILNYVDQPAFVPREKVTSFIYVGQVIAKKAIPLLISVFNRNPQWQLTIIGDGILRNEMEKKANDNITFLGAINNVELPKYYKAADVLILPSIIEPWGLVVEEALNNGTPVIVSSHVGCANSIVKPYDVGLVFESGNENALEKSIAMICNVELYNHFRKNVSALDFKSRSKKQVDAFI